MSLNAVQQQLRAYLNGIAVQGFTGALDARVAQPYGDFAKIGTPLLFIWGAAGSESRVAIPRGLAWKEVQHHVSMWIFSLVQANDPNRATEFPVLIDTIMATLRTVTPMPTEITDPVTGAQSQLFDLGEEFVWDYDVDRSVTDQRVVRNMCRLDVAVKENLGGV